MPRLGLLAVAVPLLFAASAFAQPPDRGDTPGLGWGPGGKYNSTPGPEAGIGIPVLIAAGAIVALNRYRRRRQEPGRGTRRD